MLVSYCLRFYPGEIARLRGLAQEDLSDPGRCTEFVRAFAEALADTDTQDGETASRVMALLKIAAFAITEALKILENAGKLSQN